MFAPESMTSKNDVVSSKKYLRQYLPKVVQVSRTTLPAEKKSYEQSLMSENLMGDVVPDEAGEC